jgi:hypothetical protein
MLSCLLITLFQRRLQCRLWHGSVAKLLVVVLIGLGRAFAPVSW